MHFFWSKTQGQANRLAALVSRVWDKWHPGKLGNKLITVVECSKDPSSPLATGYSLHFDLDSWLHPVANRKLAANEVRRLTTYLHGYMDCEKARKRSMKLEEKARAGHRGY